MKNFSTVVLVLMLIGGNGKAQQKISHQVDVLGYEVFHEKGLTGKGIRIAVLDAGFPGVDTHPAFGHLRTGKRILKTWDFIRNKEDVYTGHPHGTAVLSCMAGISDGLPMGLAPGAEYLLARTEMWGEQVREEILFEKAIDWAIENGAMIIQSSLGYTYQRYFSEEMDGKTSRAVKAVRKAVDLGILVIISLGNEGNTKWKIMGTPADGEGIISVGAIDSGTFLPESFSSMGPTADGRIKPELVAPGSAWTVTKKKLRMQSGTSFAAPLVAGFAACAWEAFPTLNAQELRERIIRSGHLYPYFDYSHGYGLPLANHLLNPEFQRIATLGEGSLNEGFSVDVTSRMGSATYPYAYDYLYYHVENPQGQLDKYGVVRIHHLGRTELPIRSVTTGAIVRVYFGGYQIQKMY